MTDDSIPLPKPADPTLDDRFLARCIAGECTLPERRALERWVGQNPEWRSAVTAMLRDGELSRTGWDSTADAVRAENRVLARVGMIAGGVRAVETGAKTQSFWSRLPRRKDHAAAFGGRYSRGWSIGAFALATVGVLLLGVVPRREVRTPDVATRSSQNMRYVTAVGQRAVVTLGDGSRVTLAPQTTLRLESDFGTTSRTVVLSGEAYFEIVNGARAPFVVRTGAITTRVLGTAFNVRRYPEDVGVRVAVVSGKVGVSAHTPRRTVATLSAGKMAVVTDTSAAVSEVDGAAPASAWVEGQLVFHKAPVPEVLAALSRWYGYQFRLTDSALVRRNLTIWLSTRSSRDALATLKLTLGVDLSFDGSIITLSPRRAIKDDAPRSREPRHIISPRIREVGR